MVIGCGVSYHCAPHVLYEFLSSATSFDQSNYDNIIMIELFPNDDKQAARERKSESFNPHPRDGLFKVENEGEEPTALDNSICLRTRGAGYSITSYPLSYPLTYHPLS